MRIVVWVDSWQFRCCGDDYGVGDRVSWRLKGSSGNWAAGVLGKHAPPPVRLLPVVGQLPGGELLGAGTVVGPAGCGCTSAAAVRHHRRWTRTSRPHVGWVS